MPLASLATHSPIYSSAHSIRSISSARAIQDIRAYAQKGDIIFRKGLNFESKVIAELSHSLFSHVDMIVELEPLQIIHATTDDDKNHANQVIISTLEDFLAQGNIFALKRLNAPKSLRTQIAQDSLGFVGRAFVLDSSEGRLYCTSFLEGLIQAHYPLKLPYQRLILPALSGYYLFPQAFWESNDFVLIVAPFTLTWE